jgi:hypothetical protein
MAVPAGQLTAAPVQRLEISFMCARALQERAQPAIQAWNGHNVSHPRLAAQMDR